MRKISSLIGAIALGSTMLFAVPANAADVPGSWGNCKHFGSSARASMNAEPNGRIVALYATPQTGLLDRNSKIVAVTTAYTSTGKLLWEVDRRNVPGGHSRFYLQYGQKFPVGTILSTRVVWQRTWARDYNCTMKDRV